MRSVNKVVLLGHVGQKPEILSTAGGTLIASFSVATSYKVKAKEGGNAAQVTEWHRLKAFGKLAEVVRDYVSKGAPVYLEGALQTRTWEKDGEKRYATEIVVNELSLLGAKKEAGTSESERRINEATAAAEQRGQKLEDGTHITDDDIPF
jgi:single-strand DNA-binding protein